MSFFKNMQTQLNNQDCLVDTLTKMGYKPQVNEKKVTVRGHGRESSQAEIILRKEDLNDGGDIGFSKDANGNYEMITDTYVMRKLVPTAFINNVTTAYNENRARSIAKKNGWNLLSAKTNNEGKRVLQFTVKA